MLSHPMVVIAGAAISPLPCLAHDAFLGYKLLRDVSETPFLIDPVERRLFLVFASPSILGISFRKPHLQKKDGARSGSISGQR